jgi:hypothetical protein
MKKVVCFLTLVLLLPMITAARPVGGGAAPRVSSGMVFAPGGREGAVGRTRDDVERYLRAVKEGRNAKAQTMLKDKRVFMLPANTKIKVLDKNLEVSRIRVLDGKHKNKAGWVATSAIKGGAQQAVKTPRPVRRKITDDKAETPPDDMLKPGAK